MQSGSPELKNVEKVMVPITPDFHWSVGNYMETFFDGLKSGKFMGVKCQVCGRVYLPPRMICENCFEKTEEWVELPDTGTLVSFTLASVKVDRDGELHDLQEPRLIGMVKHEGADTCLVARLEEIDPQGVEVGMKVKAVLREDPKGVLDILSHYRPGE
jgi:uncharacterized OB-fold protein